MPSSSYSTLILIVVMVVAFYFLIIRPQRKRQQAQQNTINQLVPGTKVLTGSGIFGTIVEIGDKQATLELSPGVQLTVLKQAIARVAGPQDENTGSADDDDTFDAQTTGYDEQPAVTDEYAGYDPDYQAPAQTDGSTHQFDRPGDDERQRKDV